MSEIVKCPRCASSWPDESEQAACVRTYDQCIVCCVELEIMGKLDWSIESVLAEKERHLLALEGR